MRLIHLLVLALAGLFLIACTKELPPETAKTPEFPHNLPTFGEPAIPGWTRVNEKERHRMPERISIRCIQLPEKVNRGDHADAFVEVFVNDTGKAAMFSAPVPNQAKPDEPNAIRFPVGSVIIKVKYSGATGGRPLFRTMMIKQAVGYNPECGDWQFAITDGPVQQVSERGKIQRCMACHKNAWMKPDDHTFRRDYLPASVLELIRKTDPQNEPARS